MTVPTILEQVVGSSTVSDYTELSRLDFVAIGGGALKSSVGNALKDHRVRLLNHYGATELGALAHIHIPDEAYDWHFLRIRNDTGLNLTETGTDTNNGRLFKLSGRPFGWNADFEVQDSLVKNAHGVSSEHVEVRVTGRTDDLIVLATGEKVRPQAIESHLEALPYVKAAVVFGEQQDEVGVLVELQDRNDAAGDQGYMDLLWSSIQDVNRTLDGHARISSKDAILLKPRDKDISRSDKGSVMRQEVYRTFSEELKAAYRRLSMTTTAQTGSAIDVDNIEASLRSLIELCLQDRIASTHWKTEDDFFELGMDSLEATRLARCLGRLPNTREFPGLTTGISGPLFIYSNPTIGRLAAAMLGRPIVAQQDRSLRMQRLRDKHAFEMRLCQGSSPREQFVMLLTGSTGSLGAHLLCDLAKTQSVERVICVNRASSKAGPDPKSSLVLRERQESVNARHGLAFSDEMWNKIELIASDTSKQDLGLKPQARSRIAGQVTHILHNAWPMDFQRTLDSFEGQVHAVRNLLDLAQDARNTQKGRKPKLIFLSSIAVTGRCPEKLVFEQRLSDPSSTVPMGYAEAKWVCEEVLACATQSMGDKVEPVIIRIGQLSGSSTTGYWNPTEHLAAIMKTSHDIAALPALQGASSPMLILQYTWANSCQAFSWLPVDVAAKVIREISFADRCQNRYYHVENPVRQSWSHLLDYFRYKLEATFPKVLLFEQWLDNALIPAGGDGIAPLEEFLRDDFRRLSSGQLVLDTRNARSASPTLRSHGGIPLDLIDKYLQSWKVEGIFQN
ncbi:MAG: hypothetical protein LQ338_005147 [Usnochroma carphineum]|nr:MAG: hypothetical protein LQ338_005147 [Usnochroma carphineum]